MTEELYIVVYRPPAMRTGWLTCPSMYSQKGDAESLVNQKRDDPTYADYLYRVGHLTILPEEEKK